VYVDRDIHERANSTLIVHGTGADSGSNRYAAEQVRKRLYRRGETSVSIVRTRCSASPANRIPYERSALLYAAPNRLIALDTVKAGVFESTRRPVRHL